MQKAIWSAVACCRFSPAEACSAQSRRRAGRQNPGKPNRVVGYSDAPSFLVGDLVLVNELAYDIRLPFTDVVLFNHSQPRRGDVVQFRQPESDDYVFKRIVACPGDILEMKNYHLTINSVPLSYSSVHASYSPEISSVNQIGSVVEWERGNGPEHLITFTSAETGVARISPFRVAPGHYYVIGDNRYRSLDSRHYGLVARNRILGKVSLLFH